AKYRASRESKAKASQGSILPTDEFQTCSICTEDFLEDVNLRPLPYGHRFHPSCIDPWLLERSVTCPLCRLSVAAGLIPIHSEVPARPRRVLFLTQLWAHPRHRPRVKFTLLLSSLSA
ncbi:hypothetical protein B0J13DRAFT_613122, partial [Dactylonectria estremocensis]